MRSRSRRPPRVVPRAGARRSASLGAVALAGLAACGGGERTEPGGAAAETPASAATAGAPAPSGAAQMVVDTVATDLEVPWGLSWAPDGRLFVTERPGRIRVVENGGLRGEPWATLDVVATAESGLLDIAVAPDFASSGHVYVVGTFRGPNGLVDRVVRLTDQNGSGVDPTVVVDGIPAERVHAGSALAFGPDGLLYVSAGDATAPSRAQDRSTLHGKILRYTPAGEPAPGNPTAGSPVYALGLRNVQGLDWNAEGQLFATDHGPSGIANEGGRTGHDELNAIRAGGNYGWPEVAGTSGTAAAGAFIPPIVDWTPATAPSGMAVYTGPDAPEWQGDVFVGQLRGTGLRRVDVAPDPDAPENWRAAGQELVVEGYGRIREVAMGPDGRLYFTTSNRDGRGDPRPPDDMVLRLVPAG